MNSNIKKVILSKLVSTFFNILSTKEKPIMAGKIPFSLEIDFHASPQLLFQYLSTPSGLSEWFADNVNSWGRLYLYLG